MKVLIFIHFVIILYWGTGMCTSWFELRFLPRYPEIFRVSVLALYFSQFIKKDVFWKRLSYLLSYFISCIELFI